MESYVLNGCAQWEFIMGSMGMLNGESILDAAGEIIVCFIGVLKWKLLVCSMGS